MRQWTFGFLKLWGISWLAEELSASQGQLCSCYYLKGNVYRTESWQMLYTFADPRQLPILVYSPAGSPAIQQCSDYWQVLSNTKLCRKQEVWLCLRCVISCPLGAVLLVRLVRIFRSEFSLCRFSTGFLFLALTTVRLCAGLKKPSRVTLKTA